MAIDNFKIICEQWEWYKSATPLEEVNFFRKAFPLNPVKQKSINLADYCISKDSIVINKKTEDIDLSDDNAGLELFKTYDNISLSFTNIGNEKLTEWFNLFNTEFQRNTAPYTRYKILVYKSINGADTLIFQGVLNSSDIKYDNPDEVNDREIITLDIYSWDKEFQNFFSKKEMPDISNYIGTNYWESGWAGYTFDNISFGSLLTNFYTPDIDITDSGINSRFISGWRIVRRPQMMMSVVNTYNTSLHWFLNGYDYVRDNLKLDMFTFLKYLCNSMGWVFYWERRNNALKFVVRNRVPSETGSNALRLDFGNVKNYYVSFEKYTLPARIIKISIMELISGGDVFNPLIRSSDYRDYNGARDRIFVSSDISTEEVSTNFSYFNKFKVVTPDTIHDEIDFDNGYRYNRLADTNNNKHHYVEYGGSVTGPFRKFDVTKHYYYDNNELLHIKAGDNFFNVDKKRRRTISANTESDYFRDGEIGNNELIFSGNIGTGMFYAKNTGTIEPYFALSSSFYNNAYVHYRSDQFDKNMRALLTEKANTVVEIEVMGFYDNANSVISFTNTNEQLFNGTFDILELQTDAISETTKFKLRKRNG